MSIQALNSSQQSAQAEAIAQAQGAQKQTKQQTPLPQD
jgi:hypothetical protein